jgi:hypothetical protein
MMVDVLVTPAPPLPPLPPPDDALPPLPPEPPHAPTIPLPATQTIATTVIATGICSLIRSFFTTRDLALVQRSTFETPS